MLSQKDLKTLKKVFIWWIVLTAFWTAYRLFTFPELFTEVIAKPIIWLGITFIFLSFGLIPKKTLENLKKYYLQIRPLWKIITLPALFVTLYFFLINYRQVEAPLFSVYFLALTLILNFSTAIAEEIVYRGVLYVWLLQKMNEIPAFILVQVLFLVAHLPILTIQGSSLADAGVRLFFILIMGGLYTAVFRLTRSLYASILVHGIWNSLVFYFLLVS